MRFQRTKVALTLAHVLGACGAAALVAAPAYAQTPPPIKIEVTGSNIKRIEGETALPVQVITREDIDRTGATTVEQLLQTISVSLQGNTNTTAGTTAGANAAGVVGVSLRGLGSQRTLVLINGRRISAGGTITDSVTVDVNSIPLAAVQRVEVLKDGASAIYGSDAIAGVINFILRQNYQGAEATVYYGDSKDGGGSSKRVTGAAGFGDLGKDRYNVLIVGTYQEDGALFGRDRDFAKSGINVGANNDTTSGNTFPANISARDGSFGTRNPLAPDNCAPSVVSPLFPSTRCRFDPSPFVTLLPATEKGSLYGAAHYTVTPDIEAYAEASYARNRQHYVIQPSPVSNQFAIPPSHPLFNVAPYNGFAAVVLKPSSPFYPTAFVTGLTGGSTPDLDVFYRNFGSGLRDFTDTSEQPRGVIGVKGTLAGWDFDAGFLYTESKLTEHANGGIGLYTKLLPLLNSGLVNFFGPNTPDIQAQLNATNFIGNAYTTKSTLGSFSVKASKEVWQLPAGPLALALGAEFRREKFETNPDAVLRIGDTTHYGGDLLPENKARNVTALFAEVNIPIVKTLDGNAAVRYDNYQDSGSKTTPKFSLRWQPTPQVLVRGAYGKGFRAPSLTELFQPTTIAVSANGLNDPLRCNKPDANGVINNSASDCATQFPIQVGGNSQLKPETSDNYTLGVVLEPVANVSVALDAFQVKLKETIIFGVNPSAILASPIQFASLITRGPEDPTTPGLPGHVLQIHQSNLNFGETNIRGLDVDFRARYPAGNWGDFRFGLNGTYFDKYEVQNFDGSFFSINGKVSPITNGNGGVVPRWHHYLSVGWNKGPWEAVVAQNYQLGYEDIPGSFEDPSDPAFKPRRVGAYETWDLQGSYSGFQNLKLTLGIRNILNRDPPYTNAGGQNFFQAGYDPGYADPRGQFFYGSVTYTFK